MKKLKAILLSLLSISLVGMCSGCYFGPFFEITPDGDFNLDSELKDSLIGGLLGGNNSASSSIPDDSSTAPNSSSTSDSAGDTDSTVDLSFGTETNPLSIDKPKYYVINMEANSEYYLSLLGCFQFSVPNGLTAEIPFSTSYSAGDVVAFNDYDPSYNNQLIVKLVNPSNEAVSVSISVSKIAD